MPLTPAQTKTIRRRVEEGAREGGVLLIVFSPLDFAFGGAESHTATAALFFVAGVVSFAVAVVSEAGRSDDA